MTFTASAGPIGGLKMSASRVRSVGASGQRRAMMPRIRALSGRTSSTSASTPRRAARLTSMLSSMVPRPQCCQSSAITRPMLASRRLPAGRASAARACAARACAARACAARACAVPACAVPACAAGASAAIACPMTFPQLSVRSSMSGDPVAPHSARSRPVLGGATLAKNRKYCDRGDSLHTKSRIRSASASPAALIRPQPGAGRSALGVRVRSIDPAVMAPAWPMLAKSVK